MPRDDEKTKARLIAELQEARKKSSRLESRLAEAEGRAFRESRHFCALQYLAGQEQPFDALRESREELNAIYDQLPHVLLLVDRDGRVRRANRFASRVFDRPAEDMIRKSVGDALCCLRHTDDPRGCGFGPFCSDCPVRKSVLDTLESGTNASQLEVALPIRKNGKSEDLAFLLSTAPLLRRHEPLALLSLKDVTRRKRAEDFLRQKREEQETLLDSIPTQVWYLTGTGTYGPVNRAHADFCGLNREEMVNRRIRDVLTDEEARICIESNIRAFQGKESMRTEEWRHDASGDQRLLEISRTPKLDASGEVEYVVCTGTDITGYRTMEDQLRRMSLHDSLTGLNNRIFFDLEMERLSDKRYLPVGIVVCDLDGLKFVNHTLGHNKGDEMISNAAAILRQCIRGGETVARIGGDEFAILLPRTDDESIHRFVQRLRKEAEKFNAMGTGIPVSLSIGYAVGSTERTDMQVLFRVADNRMYREKIQKKESPRSGIVRGMTKAFEARDFVSNGHCDRIQKLAVSLARGIGLPEDRINELCLFARFHDLGKVGIYDQILFKAESLDENEFLEMQKHSEVGYRIAQSVPELAFIADWILKHHEWWDGRGYPLGLQGRDIPLECRIISIVDAFDVMTNDRPYHHAMPRDEAIQELRRCAGSQFDPDLVECFIRILDQADHG